MKRNHGAAREGRHVLENALMGIGLWIGIVLIGLVLMGLGE